MLDLSLSAAVLWWLLPPAAAHPLRRPFWRVYAAAVIAGIISHVPGGVGVFEAVILFTLPNVPADALLGSLLAYRAVYYVVPLVFGTLLFGCKELSTQRARDSPGRTSSPACTSRRSCRRSPAPSPSSPARCCCSRARRPAVDERLAFLDQLLPLAVLEVSHLVGSVVGLGLLVLARALFRRVQAAYHISVWLLVAGIFASLLKGLDFEEASLLALVLGVLHARAARLLSSDRDPLRTLHAGVGGEHRRA